MRPALLAAVLLISVAAVRAQELSPDADRAMWCGAAFAVMQQAAGGADAAALGGKADQAFARAAEVLIAAGMTVEDFGALAEDYAGRLLSPFRTGGYTQDECEALVATE